MIYVTWKYRYRYLNFWLIIADIIDNVDTIRSLQVRRYVRKHYGICLLLAMMAFSLSVLMLLFL
jgi:hypothetical protein